MHRLGCSIFFFISKVIDAPFLLFLYIYLNVGSMRGDVEHW